MVADPIQAAVDGLAGRLRRSVVINDAAVHLLYASAHYGDEDPVRIRAVLQREADSRAIGHVLAQGVATWTTAGVIPPEPSLGMRARVCVPVRWRGELLGLLMVMDADGTLTTGELITITEVAQTVAPLLLPQGRNPVLRRQALADLAASLFEPVTVVEFAVRGATAEPTAAHATTALRAALPGGRLHAIAGDTAVLLLGAATGLRSYVEGLVDRVRDLSAGRFTCVAGIGAEVPGPEHAFESAEQARLARRAAADLMRVPVATWDELGPYAVLLRIPPDELTEAALPAELRLLRRADPAGELTRTLRSYLNHAGNGPAASAELHIHRTTLYYRLGRIRELTGLDLDDGRIRLTLHLGLFLTDLL